MSKSRQQKLKRKMNSINGIQTPKNESGKKKDFLNFELVNGMSLTVFKIDNKKSLALGVNVALADQDQLTTGVATLTLPFDKTYEFANELLGYSITITGKPTVPTVKMGKQDFFATCMTHDLLSTTKKRKAVIALLNSHLNKYGLSTKDYGIK